MEGREKDCTDESPTKFNNIDCKESCQEEQVQVVESAPPKAREDETNSATLSPAVSSSRELVDLGKVPEEASLGENDKDEKVSEEKTQSEIIHVRRTSPQLLQNGEDEIDKNSMSCDSECEKSDRNDSADEAHSDNTSTSSSGSIKTKKCNRCQVCRKKVGLAGTELDGFVCRCDGLFCSLHRYSDKHECNFDYREMGAVEIRKNNPVIASEKINKI